MFKDTEVAALQATIAELEEKLVKVSLLFSILSLQLLIINLISLFNASYRQACKLSAPRRPSSPQKSCWGRQMLRQKGWSAIV